MSVRADDEELLKIKLAECVVYDLSSLWVLTHCSTITAVVSILEDASMYPADWKASTEHFAMTRGHSSRVACEPQSPSRIEGACVRDACH
jgi:hypothetical protein